MCLQYVTGQPLVNLADIDKARIIIRDTSEKMPIQLGTDPPAFSIQVEVLKIPACPAPFVEPLTC